MAKISKKDVEHIANLARLGISEKEKTQFAGQLSDVLSYVERLNKVDTEGVEPTAQVTGLTNVTREDEPGKQVADRATKEELLQNVPQTKDGYFKVPIILEQNEIE